MRVATFLPNLGTLGFLVLELFATYATGEQTDGQTDRRTDGRTKATLISAFLRSGQSQFTLYTSQETDTAT